MTTPSEQERQLLMEQSELDRQLEMAHAEQNSAMPGWKDLLTNIFGRQSDNFTARQKAAIIGAPGRRNLFRIGGASIAGAALIAACGSDDNGAATIPPSTDAATPVATDATESPASTDAMEESATTDAMEETAADGPTDMDLALLRTATSLEIAAVDTYQAAIDAAEALGISAPVAEAASLFQAHHAEHAAALQGGTEAAGGTPYEEANPFLMENVITPALEGLTDEASVLMLALTLEIAASQTYTFAGSALSLPSLRQTIMSIGGVEERHAAVLRGVLGQPQVPNSFNPTTDAAPEASFVSAS